MNFKQKVLSHLLTTAQYSHLNLRPDQVLVISRVKNNKIINITINAKSIDYYRVKNFKKTPVLKSNKIEQYQLVCLLAGSLENPNQKTHDEDINLLTIKQKHKLKSLSYAQLIHLVNTTAVNIIELNVHTRALKLALYISNRQNEKDKKIEKLINAGATKRFMNQEYGVTPQQYKFLRTAFSLDKAFGRPRILSELESHKVYNIWQKNRHEKIGEIYLIIHEEMNEGLQKNINIRNIATAIDQIVDQTA